MSDGKTPETHAGEAAVGGDGAEAIPGCCPAHTCVGGAGREAFGEPSEFGGPYPLYGTPRFASFSELVEYIEATWGTSTAFEPANEQAVSYHDLAGRIAHERMEMNKTGEGRFVDVSDADPVQFAARYLAVVSSRRCAVLCGLTEGQKTQLANVPEGVCTLAASSGTSGDPKVVMLTEAVLVADLTAGLELYEFARGGRYAKLLPYTHAFGLVCDLLAPLVTGGTIAVPHASATFVAELPRIASTALNLPPRAAAMLAGLLDAGTYKLPSLRKILCGGAGLAASVTQRMRVHGIEAFGCYGLTECSPCVSVNRDGWHKDGSCGVALRCNEIRTGEHGEVLVRGANVMVGYLGRPELTASRIEGDGWLHTGDVGHVDNDGFLFVDGRLDDAIVLADGTMVAPEVLERTLEDHPAIAQAFVYGTPGRRCGQTVLACKLVLREGLSYGDRRDAVDFAHSVQTPEGTRIEHIEISDEPLPRNAAGKLLRRLA